MKVSLLHPSRGRPAQALQTETEWINKSGWDDLEIVVSVDRSDDKSQLYMDLNHGYLCDLLEENAHIIRSDNSCVVQATNHAAKISSGDILIYLSDDFRCPDNWGHLVIKEFEDAKGPRLIKVDDCLQAFDIPVLTIPIMNRALYEKLGYFWHPEYKSMFVDQDLFEVCRKMNVIKYCPHLKFRHDHPSVSRAFTDDTYRRSEANWDQGKELFKRRQRQGFPV